MDCCNVETADVSCPSCGARGRTVGRVTLEALVQGRNFDGDAWKFCRTPDCPVAYYAEGNIVPVDAVSVTITQKSTDPRRPVCYCFGYSAHDIESDVDTAIPADIKERCRRGEDHCTQTNPQGSCCLGNVLAIGRPAS